MNINRWIAKKGTGAFGTMTCVWSFLVWSILPLIFPQWSTAILYVSAGVIQLVALPLLMVGSKESDLMAKEMHDTILTEFAILKEMHEESRLHDTNDRLMARELHALVKELHSKGVWQG